MDRHDDNRWHSCCGRQGEIKKKDGVSRSNTVAELRISKQPTTFPADLHQKTTHLSTLCDFLKCDGRSHGRPFSDVLKTNFGY